MPDLKESRQNPKIFSNQFGTEDSGGKQTLLLGKMQLYLFETGFASISVGYYSYLTSML